MCNPTNGDMNLTIKSPNSLKIKGNWTDRIKNISGLFHLRVLWIIFISDVPIFSAASDKKTSLCSGKENRPLTSFM